jgi:RPA family protein
MNVINYRAVFERFSKQIPGFDMRDPIGSIERYFGKADPETQKFRDDCASRGFVAVMYSGMTREQVLKVLSSLETTRILARN